MRNKIQLTLFFTIVISVLSSCAQGISPKTDTLRKEVVFYDSLHLKSETWYRGNVVDSIYKEWYYTGEIKELRFYSAGLKNGVWEKYDFGSRDHQYGYHTYSEYNNGQLIEERIYEFHGTNSNLFKLLSYNYDPTKHDTIKVQRQFYPQTGIMTLMDTLINGSYTGISKSWSEKDGRLIEETYISNGKIIWRKFYDRQNNIKIDNYHDNGIAIKEELVYNGLNKLIEERHYDEKGILISEKKY